MEFFSFSLSLSRGEGGEEQPVSAPGEKERGKREREKIVIFLLPSTGRETGVAWRSLEPPPPSLPPVGELVEVATCWGRVEKRRRRR